MMRFFLSAIISLLIISLVHAADIFSLHPHPKEAYAKTGAPFAITAATEIAVSNDSPQALRAIELLNARLQLLIRDTLKVIESNTDNSIPPIRVMQFGDSSVDSFFATIPDAFRPGAEGYVIDADSAGVLIFTADANAAFNAFSTLLQLINVAGATASISACRIEDEPDYHTRWVFSEHNLLVSKSIGDLKEIEDTMFMHKLNGLQQNDFKYNILDVIRSCCPNYFLNVNALRRYSAERNISIIPGVAGIGYSDGILFNDPDLAEGAPAAAEYYMHSDTGMVIADSNVALPNGAFESVNPANNQFTGWSFYDGPNQSVFVDHSVYHGGSTSARCTNFSAGNAAGNCRFERLMTCQPNHYYYLTAWCKTQGFSGGEVQLLALGADEKNTQSLTYTQFSVPATSDWMQLRILFNTLKYSELLLYCGVWGGKSGTIWWDDFQVREAGLVNVLRRPGAPLHVWNKQTGAIYTEGVDFAPIVDSIMIKNQGGYPYHTPVTFRRIPGGAIANGDTIMISFFHPLTVYSDNNMNGSVMVCVSEDTLYSILRRQIAGVDSLYLPAAYFMGHDEIRNMNRDSSCLRRGLVPAQLLAGNVQRCSGIIQNVNPNAKQYIWSDMFDSLHNARNNYYFVNGDLSGDWNDLSRSLTIVNWNYGNRLQSLRNFAQMGFSQITSPYYDVQNTVNIRNWNLAMRQTPNIEGEMYTTWANDYSYLPQFADYAWSTAPYIFHTPVDVSDTDFYANPVLTASVMPDEYDPSDSIVSVIAGHTICGSDSIIYDTLRAAAQNHYAAALRGIARNCGGFMYFIEATNAQGITRRVPLDNGMYRVGYSTASGVALLPPFAVEPAIVENYPNPFTSETHIRFRMPDGMSAGMASIKIYNMLGKEVKDLTNRVVVHKGDAHIADFIPSELPAGVYYAIVRCKNALARSRDIIYLR